MPDLLGVQKDIELLRKSLSELLGRIDQLETKVALDVQTTLAPVLEQVSKFREAVDTITLTVNAGVNELNNSVIRLLNDIERLDGATLTFKLGPKKEM